MSARVVMVAAVFLLAILSSVFSAPAESQATVESWQSGSGSSDYDDLVTLFFEFRAAQDPPTATECLITRRRRSRGDTRNCSGFTVGSHPLKSTTGPTGNRSTTTWYEER